MATQPKISAGRIRALAVEGDVHPRTVVRALQGLPIRGLAGDRVLAVLKKHGIQVEPQSQSVAA